jgi:pimeloyl-ACP methyl ester carboxylesterase
VLLGPMYSAASVFTNLCPGFMDAYPVYKYIQDVQCPVLLAHARKDTVIPVQHSEWLYKKLPAGIRHPPLAYLPGGHNDFGWQEFASALTDFIRSLSSDVGALGAQVQAILNLCHNQTRVQLCRLVPIVVL